MGNCSFDIKEREYWIKALRTSHGQLMGVLQILDYHFPITAPGDERHVAAKKALFKEPLLDVVRSMKELINKLEKSKIDGK